MRTTETRTGATRTAVTRIAILALWFPMLCPAGNRTWLERANADAKTASLQNPEQARPGSAEAGARLYQRYCASCHGKERDGAGGGPPLPSLNTERASPGALYWLLRNGSFRNGMPSWSQLPPEQRWQLITWIKSLE